MISKVLLTKVARVIIRKVTFILELRADFISGSSMLVLLDFGLPKQLKNLISPILILIYQMFYFHP